MDIWRWIDATIIAISIGLFLIGTLKFIPFLLITLTILEIISEIAIRQYNYDWNATALGTEWIRNRVKALRYFFIALKAVIVLVIIVILSTA